jgi:hypothetical protein
VLAGLTRLVTVDGTGRRARRRITLTGSTKPHRDALEVFVDRRLLLSDIDHDGQVWLTVAHEALLTEWKPLDTVTADTMIALRSARTVEQAVADWNSAGRPEHYLWDHQRLTATLTTLGMTRDGNSRNPTAPRQPELNLAVLLGNHQVRVPRAPACFVQVTEITRRLLPLVTGHPRFDDHTSTIDHAGPFAVRHPALPTGADPVLRAATTTGAVPSRRLSGAPGRAAVPTGDPG